MADKFRAVIIGAGSRAMSVIYPSLADMPDVDLVAICDIDPERRRIAAERYQVARVYGDTTESYRDMIEEMRPDGVFAIGQPHLFYDIWQWCLEHGQNLYVEKPLALTLHQARSLAWLAEQNNCVTAVSFQRRKTPLVVMLREKCLERGPITHAVCRFYKCDIKPNVGARDHMMDDCVHAIDTLRWICGGEVVRVESHTRRVGVPDINFIAATLFFDNGATGYLLNSWSSGKRIFSVEMHAPGIFAEAEHEVEGHLYADGDVKGQTYHTAEVAGSESFHVYTGVAGLCREFVDAVRSQTRPTTCFADAVKTMEVAEIILAQALLDQTKRPAGNGPTR
jgi:predicted dehydrogenase